MTIHDTFAGAQFATAIANLAQDNGMTLRVGSDFGQYGELVGIGRPDQPVGDPFNPEKQPVTSENAFWITGWNERGDLVHTQAMRRFSIPGTLAEFMTAKFREFPPAGVPLNLDTSRYIPGPGARRIRGSVCYHGEAWLKPGESSYRGTGLAGALARFALASAVLRWSPDYVFGFMPEHHAFRGLIEREGYMHSDPGALFWHRADSNEILRGYLVWMGRDDLSHMMGLPPELLLVA